MHLETDREGILVTDVLHNVRDGRRGGWTGSWEIEPLDVSKLTSADIGRTVIYQDFARAEAGTLSSWRNEIVFARYSRGDTAAGASPGALVFGVRHLDGPDFETPEVT